jgi:CBS domain-containing protein
VLTEDATVFEAVARMLHFGFDHIPMVRHGMPVGIVARQDFLRLTLRLSSHWPQDLQRELGDLGTRTKTPATSDADSVRELGTADTARGPARRPRAT